MRRSIVTMLAGLVGLSTPLIGQGGALGLGIATTLGGGWQIEAFDVGYAHQVRAGPVAVMGVSARLGSFVDEGAIVGGAQGFVFGATLSARTPAATLFQVGADTNSGRVGLDLTVEATGYLGSHSPLPLGSPWGAISLLPGVRFGDPNSTRFGFLLGPSVFLGDVAQVRAFLGIRVETRLARGERHP